MGEFEYLPAGRPFLPPLFPPPLCGGVAVECDMEEEVVEAEEEVDELVEVDELGEDGVIVRRET